MVAGPYDPKTYPVRTRLNVGNSDGTVIFGDPASPGSRFTVRLCVELGKPFTITPTAEWLKEWVEEERIGVLNVAGNRESKYPGIGQLVVDTLLGAFKEV